MNPILLIEDEPGLVMTITDLLNAEGHRVESVSDGDAGLAKATREKFALVIVDVMLPKKTGFEVCRQLRQAGIDTAILMLTAKTHVTDRVVGLKLGADDYLAKPFDPSELLARVESLLRRIPKKKRIPVAQFEFGNVSADFALGQVHKKGEPVTMAAKELQLLRYLIDRRGTVVSREELLQNVWEYQAEVSSRTIDVHVAWLRQKLEDNPQSPQYIHTVRGVGYRFTA